MGIQFEKKKKKPFKVGTLDSLMQISDELVKNDLYAETTLFKLAANLANLLDKDQKTFESSLMVNGSEF